MNSTPSFSPRLFASLSLLAIFILVISSLAVLPARADGGGPDFTPTLTPTVTPTITPAPIPGQDTTGQEVTIQDPDAEREPPEEGPTPTPAPQVATRSSSTTMIILLAALIAGSLLVLGYLAWRRRQ